MTTSKTNTHDQIDAVRRGLGLREVDGREAKVLTAIQTYPTDRADVWDAITTAERIPRWLMPISGDLKLGGTYQLEGNAGGTITECRPTDQLALTWEFGGMVSWVTVRLAEESGATTLTLEHVAHVDPDPEIDYGPGAVGIGWDSMLLGLHQHLTTGEGVRPEDAMAWMMSEEGITFMRRSGEAWRDADIALGTPKDKAQAAFEACFAAYTAAPPEAE